MCYGDLDYETDGYYREYMKEWQRREEWMQTMRLTPYKHQLEGIQALIDNPIFALFDEMGVGKTKQVIDAAQTLAIQGKIKKVIVIAPAAVRSVWFNEDFGELTKHLWHGTCQKIVEYHSKVRSWTWGEGESQLKWIITNYDFIRPVNRLNPLRNTCDSETLLVFDESSAIKNHKAKQTKACLKLRKSCGRVILLNGTPIAHSPNDMFSQGEMLHSKILNCSNYYQFRSRYAILGGWHQKQIIGWQNLDDLQRRFAPYVLRRLKTQCLDLPAKLPPVTLEVPLSSATWKIYKEMRDEMVAWLTEQTVSLAAQAVVKAIRLSQLTTGFLGGVQEMLDEGDPVTEELSREKLDFFLGWLKERLDEDPSFKVLVWCRFRAELSRLKKELDNKFPIALYTGTIRGAQKKSDREEALRLLDPRTTPKLGPVVVLGSPQAGGMGLNLTAAHNVMYLSNDYSLKTRLQSEDRVHRPGQVHPVSYFDVIATGPKGQKTIDHIILKSLRTKESIATMTTSAWLKELVKE